MEINDSSLPPKLNPQAAYSLALGMLSILFLFPLPFTGLVCLPFSLFSGLLALLLGITALSRIRRRRESGRPLAWAGIILGGIIVIGAVCMSLAALALFFHVHGSFQPPPLFENFQL